MTNEGQRAQRGYFLQRANSWKGKFLFFDRWMESRRIILQSVSASPLAALCVNEWKPHCTVAVGILKFDRRRFYRPSTVYLYGRAFRVYIKRSEVRTFSRPEPPQLSFQTASELFSLILFWKGGNEWKQTMATVMVWISTSRQFLGSVSSLSINNQMHTETNNSCQTPETQERYLLWKVTWRLPGVTVLLAAVL